MGLSLVREDRDGLTAGKPVMPPGVRLGSYVGNRLALKASMCETRHELRLTFRVVVDDYVDRLQV